MILKLPEYGRPRGVRYRECALGVDLPAQFIHDLRGLDQHLYPIFHPYEILYDDMVNEYVGPLEDPRYSIVENSFRLGELVMGHILSNGQGVPTPDGTWHLWRWCEPARAWAHIINIDSTDELYLQLLVKRLWLQAQHNDRYGHRGYQKLMEQADLDERERLMKEHQDLIGEINKANSAMLNRAMQNMASGKTAPTMPEKEIIVSGGGLTGAKKIVRPITDREGGLVLPDDIGD
jgi:hypothetical protein